MLADTLGINLYTINTAEGGALGAVILAMVGCKQYKTVSDACHRIVKVVDTYKCNKTEHQRYLVKFDKFKKIYQALKSL
ncbi:hypothetical protein FACS1894152_0790 [Bacilli bacterium]|nr:hypothetical protein FACS1894152_0790 [Bacilli bacterium]